MTWRTMASTLVALGLLASVAAAQTIVVIDDGTASTPNTTDITWTPGTSDWNYRADSGTNSKPHSYNGTGSRFAFAKATSPIATATYTPDLPEAGEYRVDMWWPTFGWADNVPVTVTYATGVADLVVDQSTNSGQWNTLGTFEFDAGTAGSVMISSEGTNPGGSNVGPVADAVRFLCGVVPGRLPLTAVADASSTHPQDSTRPAANVVNGSGMTDQDADLIPDTHAANDYGAHINWMSNTLPTSGLIDEWLTLDLGESFELDVMKVWNFNATGDRTDRGVGTADLYYSMLDDPGIDFTDPAFWTLLRQVTLSEALGDSSYNTPDVIPLGGIEARWLALDILSTQGSTQFVGLSEIQVLDVIPEPATLTLLALGALGLLRRRQRKP